MQIPWNRIQECPGAKRELSFYFEYEDYSSPSTCNREQWENMYCDWEGEEYLIHKTNKMRFERHARTRFISSQSTLVNYQQGWKKKPQVAMKVPDFCLTPLAPNDTTFENGLLIVKMKLRRTFSKMWDENSSWLTWFEWKHFLALIIHELWMKEFVTTQTKLSGSCRWNFLFQI